MKSTSKGDLLRFVGRSLKNINNKQFREDVNYIYHNPYSIFIDHLGNLNPGILVYPIYIDSDGWGFWASMRRVLSNLWYADLNGFVPDVKFSLSGLYAEKAGFMQTDNPFEYYFEPIGVEGVEKSQAVIRCRDNGNPMFGDRVGTIDEYVNTYFNCQYDVSTQYIEQMGKVWNKYLKFNKQTKKLVCKTEIVDKICAKKTIGVHVRGTDYGSGLSGHPVKIEDSQYVKYLKEIDCEQIFVATDEERVIKKFQEIFPDKVIFYKEILRSKDGQPVHFSSVNREHHHYMLGIEILKDSYALACCNSLVCGVSQVSNGVRVMKSSMQEEFRYLQIFDKGRYK